MKNIILIFLAFLFFPKILFSQIFINGNADIKCVDNVDLTLVETDFQNNGIFDAGNGTVLFKEDNGTGNLLIDGNSTTTFNNITINLQNQNLQLNQTANANGTITFSNGNFELNTFNLNLGTNAMVSGETENSSFTGNNGGNVNISTNLNAPNAVNPGNLGAIITSAANLGATTVSVHHMENTNGTDVSIKRTYTISPTNNSGLNATLRFQYLDTELNGHTESDLELWRDDGSGWQNMGFTSRDATQNYIELSGIDAFSQWTAFPQVSPLPVELVNFTARKQDNQTALLSWETASEINNEGFEIERGLTDNSGHLTWETVDFIVGHGTTTQNRSYEFLDRNPMHGINYYRLRQLDFDGNFSYSEIRTLNFKKEDTKVGAIFPNPSMVGIEEIKIPIFNSETSNLQVRISDTQGRNVFQSIQLLDPGDQQLTIPISNWPAGVYFIFIKMNNETITQKLIIQE